MMKMTIICIKNNLAFFTEKEKGEIVKFSNLPPNLAVCHRWSAGKYTLSFIDEDRLNAEYDEEFEYL